MELYEAALVQVKAYNKLKGIVGTYLVEYGLNASEWVALSMINKLGKVKPITLAKLMKVEKPYITELTKKLEKLNFITISQDELDGRSKSINLNGVGKMVVEKIQNGLDTKLKKVMADITDEDLNIYFKVLKGIIDSPVI